MKPQEELMSLVFKNLKEFGPLSAFENHKRLQKRGRKIELQDVQHALVAHEIRGSLVISDFNATNCIWDIPKNS